MSVSHHRFWVGSIAVAASFFCQSLGRAQESPPADAEAAAQAGITGQARGPIHEAFAQPVTDTAHPGLIAPKQPSDPVPEEPPEQKPEGENVQWIPGYWAWDNDKSDYIWVSGFWRVPPPGRRWVPGYW